MAKQKVKTAVKRATVLASVAKEKDRKVVAEGSKLEHIGPPMKFTGTPAMLRVSLGTTLNMGNYEFLRIGVDLELPCSPDKAEAAFKVAEKFVEAKLDGLIKKHRSSESGMEGLVV